MEVDWETWNDAQYSVDTHTREAALLDVTQCETHELYSLQQLVLLQECGIFYTSGEAHFTAEHTSQGQ